VIKSDGRIGGYKGGTKKKINLLKKEGIIIKNGRIIKAAENNLCGNLL
jgi:alkylated DNA nucleotide flippase Atl1